MKILHTKPQYIRRLLLCGGLLCSGYIGTIHLYAQEDCGYDQALQQALQKRGLTYEQYMEENNQNMQTYMRQIQGRTEEKVYKIPVVVHVLHFGAKVGAAKGYNISQGRIEAQIRILNEAFAETHPHVDRIPTRFQSVRAGDTNIRFYLAKKDPNGVLTHGITRTKIKNISSEISYSEVTRIRPSWNTTHYINIWVIPRKRMIGTYSGIAFVNSFFVSTDAFGPRSNPYYDGGKKIPSSHQTAPYRTRGITSVHEVGHCFGLSHTWGRGTYNGSHCFMDDGCGDTPNQERSTNWESSCEERVTSCGSPDMMENYMDYSSSACMAMFTQCQKTKMRAYLNSSSGLWNNADKVTETVATAPKDIEQDAYLNRQGRRISTLETEQTSVQAKNAQQSDSLSRHEDEIVALKTKNAAQDVQFTVIHKRNNKQSDSLSRHENEITALKAKISALETEINTLKGSSTLIYNVPQAPNKGSARLYPNPSKRYLQFANLSPTQSYTYKIYAPTGTLLRSGLLKSSDTLNISSLPQGPYILTLHTAEGEEMLRSTLLIKP